VALLGADPRYPDGYQGWKNWETWEVFLWLTNSSPALLEEAREAAKDGDEALRAFVEEEALRESDDAPVSLARDLVSHSLDVVDWAEVRKALLEL